MLSSSNQQRRPGNIDDLPEFRRAMAHVSRRRMARRLRSQGHQPVDRRTAAGAHRMRPLALLGLLLLANFMIAFPPEASAKVQLFRRTAQKLMQPLPPPPHERSVTDGPLPPLSMR